MSPASAGHFYPLHRQESPEEDFLELGEGVSVYLCVLSDPPGTDLTEALFLREAHDSQVEFLKQDLLSKERKGARDPLEVMDWCQEKRKNSYRSAWF